MMRLKSSAVNIFVVLFSWASTTKNFAEPQRFELDGVFSIRYFFARSHLDVYVVSALKHRSFSTDAIVPRCRVECVYWNVIFVMFNVHRSSAQVDKISKNNPPLARHYRCNSCVCIFCKLRVCWGRQNKPCLVILNICFLFTPIP